MNFFSKSKYVPDQPRTNRSLFNMSGGTAITPDSAMEVSAYYSGVIYLSTQIAKLPWEIKDADNRPQLNHHARKMLRLKPNKEMNSFMLRLMLMQSAITEGNGYAEIERDKMGRAISLWPIPAGYVDPFRDTEGNLFYRIIGGGFISGEDAFIPADDMFHLRNFHTKDGITGMGVVDYAKEILGIGKGADKFSNSTFANGALPSGVLTTEGSLSDTAKVRVTDSWKENHGGRKVGGTAILEEGMKYQAISHSPEALQMLSTKKMNVIDICRFLRIPPTKLFDTEAATFNNQENSNLEVATDTLDAWVRNIEMEADVKILSNGYKGLKSELDIFEVFRGDMDTRSSYFTRQMNNAAITPNEIRKKEGLAPYEGGDEFYIANNNFAPVDRVNDLIDAQIKSKDSGGDKELIEALSSYFANKKR